MKLNPLKIGGLQALGLILYCGIIGLFLRNANQIFGGGPDPFWAPLLFLSLLSVSVLVCALITLGYPFLIFFDRKNPRQALEVVVYTAAWLALFVIGFILVVALGRSF